MSGQRGLVPSNFVEKVADESEMSLMMNGTGDGIGKMMGYFHPLGHVFLGSFDNET